MGERLPLSRAVPPGPGCGGVQPSSPRLMDTSDLPTRGLPSAKVLYRGADGRRQWRWAVCGGWSGHSGPGAWGGQVLLGGGPTPLLQDTAFGESDVGWGTLQAWRAGVDRATPSVWLDVPLVAAGSRSHFCCDSVATSGSVLPGWRWAQGGGSVTPVVLGLPVKAGEVVRTSSPHSCP